MPEKELVDDMQVKLRAKPGLASLSTPQSAVLTTAVVELQQKGLDPFSDTFVVQVDAGLELQSCSKGGCFNTKQASPHAKKFQLTVT